MKLKTFHYTLLFCCTVTLLLIGTSCRKVSFTTDSTDQLEFSSDTLFFDTLFTTIGSATRRFKIYNRHNQSINISEIAIAGGAASKYRMNVDGLPGAEFKDIEIAPNDSVFVHAEVTIDPSKEALPFLVVDSVRFITNGNIQHVRLEAYGQNAHFYRGVSICDEVWEDDLPHVVLSTIYVPKNCQLTIREGCNVYVHAQANIIIDGSLQVNGTSDSLVHFEGDRIEDFDFTTISLFDDFPGQWGGIVFFRGSTNNRIQHCVINESSTGINIGDFELRDSLYAGLDDVNWNLNCDITIENTIIKNALNIGFKATNANVNMTNTLINAIGQNTIGLFGGNHQMTHCTFANYGADNLDHKVPILTSTNFIGEQRGQSFFQLPFPTSSTFVNCAIMGNINIDFDDEDGGELIVAQASDENVPFDLNFDHCLIRTKMPEDTTFFSECIVFESIMDSIFVSTNPRNEGGENFMPAGSSPLIDAGTSTSIFQDLYMKDRVGISDIGAIERIN